MRSRVNRRHRVVRALRVDAKVVEVLRDCRSRTITHRSEPNVNERVWHEIAPLVIDDGQAKARLDRIRIPDLDEDPVAPGARPNRLDDPGVEMQAGRQGAVPSDARDERALPAIGKEPRAAQRDKTRQGR